MTDSLRDRHTGVDLMRRGLLTALSASCLPAFAAWPDRPVKVVVPWPTGGVVDIPARLVAGKLQQALGQTFVIDNKLGAGGAIGADSVAKAAPDGLTLCVTTSAMCINKALGIKQPFDPIADFEPIALFATAPTILVVTPSKGIQSVADLVRRAREQPGKLNFGSAGNGSPAHLAGEWFKAHFKVDVVHVPYKGAPAAMIDQVAGLIDFQFANAAVALPQIRAGKVMPLAVASPHPVGFLPDVPTMDKSGAPGFDTDQWIGLLAPAGTPRDIVSRLAAETAAALRIDEVRAGMEKNGIVVADSGGTPETFRKIIAGDLARWTKVVQTANIKVE